MALVTPFVANKFTAYLEDMRVKNLSLAIRVVDEATEQPIVTGIKVFLANGQKYKPTQNLSGFYCFMDVIPGKYTLVIQPNVADNDVFFKVEKPFDIPLPLPLINALNAIPTIKLSPKPAYPFSANATLIRGVVTKNFGGAIVKEIPVVNAKVIAVYEGESGKMETSTDTNGEFVLLIKKLKLENVNEKIIKNISIKIISDNQEVLVKTQDLLKEPLKEGETGVIVIDNFPSV
jgi:hypothetical protein